LDSFAFKVNGGEEDSNVATVLLHIYQSSYHRLVILFLGWLSNWDKVIWQGWDLEDRFNLNYLIKIDNGY